MRKAFSGQGTGNKNSTSTSPLKATIARLSQYRELILLFIFFSGGASWTIGYFATRNQVEKLNCLLSANIAMVENQMNSRFYREELVRNGYEIEKLGNKDDLNETEKLAKQRLLVDSKQLNQQFLDAQKMFFQNKDPIKNKIC